MWDAPLTVRRSVNCTGARYLIHAELLRTLKQLILDSGADAYVFASFFASSATLWPLVLQIASSLAFGAPVAAGP